MNWITRFGKLASVGLLGLLAGCGGGGGAGGAGPYTINITVDKAQLPLNIAGDGPFSGRYTATLYIDARDNANRPIPGDTEAFGCSVTGGLDTGALYYLDGDPEHETTETIDGVEVTTQNAYRAITLDSNSGTASFHFHAGDTVGTVTIRCTVTEPGTNITRTAQTTIQVGGTPTGKASQVIVDKSNWAFPGYLFVQGVNSPNQGQLQASIVDEAGQLIPNPTGTANNLQVRIVPTDGLADDTATLRGVNKGGQAVAGPAIHVASINGQAQFTLVSGNSAGTVMLEFQTDRADNNVDNGIVEPIYNYVAIPVVVSAPTSGDPETALSIVTESSLPAAAEDVAYGVLLQASGGVVPYTWSKITSTLPSGLDLTSSGVISGTPYAPTSGTYNFVAQVQDAQGTKVQKSFSITYTAQPQVTPTPTPTPTLVVSPTAATGAAGGSLVFVITGGTSSYAAVSSNAAVATASTPAVTGGQRKFTVALNGAGTTDVIVTDGSGQVATVVITVTGDPGGATGSDPVVAPSSLAVSECTENIPFIIRGGTAPFTVFSTDSVNVTTTVPVLVGDFYVLTVTTNATANPGATITVLDSAYRTDTAAITVTDTHSSCLNYPEVALSPSPVIMTVGGAQVLTITGGADLGGAAGVTFTPETSDASIVSVSAVTGPDGTNSYRITLTANAVGTAIVYVESEDGQFKYVPVTVQAP